MQLNFNFDSKLFIKTKELQSTHHSTSIKPHKYDFYLIFRNVFRMYFMRTLHMSILKITIK